MSKMRRNEGGKVQEVHSSNMDPLRKEELAQLWGDETNEEWTQEWRDELTPEEQALVAKWDANACRGIRRLCDEILTLEQSNAERRNG